MADLRAAERKLLQCRRWHGRDVVRAQLRFWFFELPDSPPEQGSGKSEMSDSDDSYQSGHEYPDSIYHDAREVWSWSARLKGQRPLCVGRCIRDTSSKATERLFVAVCPRSFVLILCFLLPVSGCGVFPHCFPCSVFPR